MLYLLFGPLVNNKEISEHREGIKWQKHAKKHLSKILAKRWTWEVKKEPKQNKWQKRVLIYFYVGLKND